jgi:hypothetical protein
MRGLIPTTLALALAAGSVVAQTPINGPITVPTVLAAGTVYEFNGVVVVEPGASLTIPAGTVIANTTGGGGSLLVARGGQLFVNGTDTDPVIITSQADVATWTPDATHPTGGDPKTGMWRAVANEWGSIAICGDAYISENELPTGIVNNNVAFPDGGNFSTMEGLEPLDMMGNPVPEVQYGGCDDNDDSGSISYLSLRYAGSVLALTNELNGISLGGVGRGTDFCYVEIMNNIDDGIEIFGGTLNLDHFSIWNIGDDSLDVDQGWRGAAQFGLIVQGYSIPGAGQGSGLGDNGIEMDGAEDCDYQPVTTAQVANVTVIGNSSNDVGTDHGIALRANANVQFRQMVLAHIGLNAVQNDGDDGDGPCGYGDNGTLDFNTRFATPAFVGGAPNVQLANLGAEDMPGKNTRFDLYTAQQTGELLGVYGSVFYNNGTDISGLPNDAARQAASHATAIAAGVFAAANDNVQILDAAGTMAPYSCVVKATEAFGGGMTNRIVELDPRPANSAILGQANSSVNPIGTNGVAQSAAGGFLVATGYRGGFAPGNNWLGCWTASFAFGFTDDCMGNEVATASTTVGKFERGSTNGAGEPIAHPNLIVEGQFAANTPFEFIVQANAGSPVILTIGLEFFPNSFIGQGTLCTDLFGVGPLSILLGTPSAVMLTLAADGTGTAQIGTSNTGLNWPASTVPDQEFWVQALTIDLASGDFFLFSQCNHVVTR